MITTNEILNNKVLALSWKQPYLFLMHKRGKIETRTWNTNYRGLVLMCASQTSYKLQQVLNISGALGFAEINDAVKNHEEEIYRNRGKALYIGRLVDCRPMKEEDADKCFVLYHSDLYCHVYEDVTPIEPLPWKGSQGWKEVPTEFKQKIKIIHG